MISLAKRAMLALSVLATASSYEQVLRDRAEAVLLEALGEEKVTGKPKREPVDIAISPDVEAAFDTLANPQVEKPTPECKVGSQSPGVPLTAGQLHSTTDAAVWAAEFVRRNGGDEGNMIGWFANAIATGGEHEHKKLVGDGALLSGAIYAFMGWLTTRDAVAGPFSGRHEASSAAELVGAFCSAQGWDISDPHIPTWSGKTAEAYLRPGGVKSEPVDTAAPSYYWARIEGTQSDGSPITICAHGLGSLEAAKRLVSLEAGNLERFGTKVSRIEIGD